MLAGDLEGSTGAASGLKKRHVVYRAATSWFFLIMPRGCMLLLSTKAGPACSSRSDWVHLECFGREHMYVNNFLVDNARFDKLLCSWTSLRVWLMLSCAGMLVDCR